MKDVHYYDTEFGPCECGLTIVQTDYEDDESTAFARKPEQVPEPTLEGLDIDGDVGAFWSNHIERINNKWRESVQYEIKNIVLKAISEGSKWAEIQLEVCHVPESLRDNLRLMKQGEAVMINMSQQFDNSMRFGVLLEWCARRNLKADLRLCDYDRKRYRLRIYPTSQS